MKLNKKATILLVSAALTLGCANFAAFAADNEVLLEDEIVEEVPLEADDDSDDDDDGRHADDIIYGCLYFNEKTQMITGYYDDGNDNTNLVIPSEINGIPVLGIGAQAFMNERFTYFETIIIEEGVQTIEDEAFKYCDVDTMYIPSTITEIKYKAFYSEWLINNIYFAENSQLETIGDYAFAYCGFSSIRIPASVKTVGTCAFAGNEGLYECIFEGNAPENIDSSAFAGYLEEIVTIYFYEGNTGFTTPYWLGFRCQMLDSYELIVDESTGTITGYIDYLKPIYKDGVLQNPQDLVIPGSINGVDITRIGEDAFAEWERLGSITIENGVEYIGPYAFEKCVNAKSLFIPSTLIGIDRHAFDDTPSLEKVTFEEDSHLDYIDDKAFANSGFSEIVIPASVTEIWDNAFIMCKNLSKVYFEGNAPNYLEEDENAFDWCSPDLVLYFYEGHTGFTTPTWIGHKCVMISTSAKTDIWNFSEDDLKDLGTITSDVTIDDLTIIADSANPVQVRRNAKTLDDVTYDYCLSLRGKGSPSSRALKIDVTRDCTISIAAASNNDSRSLTVVKEDGTVVGTIPAGTELSVGSVEYTGRVDSLYIYSEKDNVNIYYVEVAYKEC